MQNDDDARSTTGAPPREATPPRHGAPRREGVQAIARAAAVLRALEARPEGLALAELAGDVALPKSTVHRLVGALASEDLLALDGEGKIVMGAGIARLAAAGAVSLPDALHPVLQRLRENVEETVDLAVPDGTRMRFVDQLAAGHRLGAVSSVGATFPLHCTANGKAYLAALPADRALALLPTRLPRMTPNTITVRSRLLDELEQVRARGIAFDHEEHTLGISAIGAAVLSQGTPVAAVSVPTPTTRFRDGADGRARAVAAAAHEASLLLTAGRPVRLSGEPSS